MEADGESGCDRRPGHFKSAGRGPLAVLALILIKLMLCSTVDGQLSPLVLEEVIEHGPLFDEFEDEAWWSGVDIVDTALRPWPLPEVPDAVVRGQSSSLDPQQSGRVTSEADDDFCSVFTTDLSVPCPSSASGDSPSVAAGLGLASVPRLPPPPPVPPFMADIVKQLHQQLDTNNEECHLCQWAQLNATVDLLPNSGQSFVISFLGTPFPFCRSLSIRPAVRLALSLLWQLISRRSTRRRSDTCIERRRGSRSLIS
jgi:hypothetical protein